MKKLALTSVCALAMVGTLFAQGTVSWNGISAAAMTAQTNTALSPFYGGTGSGGTVGSTLGAASLGTGYYYELLYAPFSGTQATISTLGNLLSWQDTGLSATNNPFSAGRLAPINPNSGATVPWPNGVTNSIVMVGWSANLGTTWAAVSNVLATSTFFAPGSFLGVSTTGYINPYATGVSPGAALFATGPSTQGLPIYSLNTQLYALPVPEPGTLALAGLGGLSLLLFRRRK